MKLYFSPLTASLAIRIALYEAGIEAEYVAVDRLSKELEDGSDYRSVRPLGLVPTLQLDDGSLLGEVGAILQKVAASTPLVPGDPPARMRLQEWLSFVGAELHKTVFAPMVDPRADDAVKRYALSKAEPRLAHVAAHLEGREFLLERFSIADAYLTTTLNWTPFTPISLKPWPVLQDYLRRMRERPHVARALGEEARLFADGLARRGKLDDRMSKLLGVASA